MWQTFDLGDFRIEAKVYEVGSQFGINGGRVSKLYGRWSESGKTAFSYDRGWDKLPQTADEMETFLKVLAKFS